MKEESLKEKIIECAYRLFTVRGIKLVTMDTIAQSLGISKRTLYEEFSSKEELLRGVIDTMGEKMLINAKEVLSSDKPSILKIVHITSLSEERSDMEKLFWHDVMVSYPNLAKEYGYVFDMLDTTVRNLLQTGIEEEYFYSNINIDTFIDMLRMPKMRFDTSITAHELLNIHKYSMVVFLRALSTPKGIDIIDKICVENNINIITGLR